MSKYLDGDTDQLAPVLHDWLMEKYGHTESKETEREYGAVLMRLRSDLHNADLDLDSDPKQVSTFIEHWVSLPQRESKVTLSAATRKQRLSIISSFYGYAIRAEVLEINPTARIKPPKVREYASATPIEPEEVERCFKAINADITIGRRDLALLLIAFTTGRRASELAHMQIGDLAFSGDLVLVRWPHMKGGKVYLDTLEPFPSRALVDWLHMWYGGDWPRKPADTPIWVRVEGDESQRGQQLSYHGIRLIFQRRLGPSHTKIHASRHSFSLMLLQSKKGSLMQLKERLGHESLDTTYRYARHILEGRDSERAQIGGAFGFGEYERKDGDE